MKFNSYQEAAILNRLAIAVPQVDSKELWYGYIQPFFNDREITPAGAVHLADSSDELAYALKLLAVDFMVKQVELYSQTHKEQNYLLANMPQEALQRLARMMGEAIQASMIAIRDTPVYG